MKIKFYLTMITCITAISFSVQAQQISISGGVLIPADEWSDSWDSGYGIQASYKIERNEQIRIGGSIGLFTVPGKEIDFLGFRIDIPDARIIPILSTFDYKINEQFYVGGDAGYNLFLYDTGDSFDSPAGSTLALIPKIGTVYNKLNAELRYNILGDSYLSVIVGFTFGN